MERRHQRPQGGVTTLSFELEPQTGADRARVVLNKISEAFDRKSIKTASTATVDGGSAGESVTALEAAQRCLEAIAKVSRGFELKSVAAQASPQGDGTSHHWAISGVFPKRRASAWAEWSLAWDDAAGSWGAARIEVTVEPFIVQDSLMDAMIKQGKVIRDQVVPTVGPPSGLKGPTLSVPFIDSDTVIQQARAAGLDPEREEFHLQTETADDHPVRWRLTRRHEDPLRFPFV